MSQYEIINFLDSNTDEQEGEISIIQTPLTCNPPNMVCRKTSFNKNHIPSNCLPVGCPCNLIAGPECGAIHRDNDPSKQLIGSTFCEPNSISDVLHNRGTCKA